MVSIFEDVQCENVKWTRGRSPTQDQPSLAVTYSLTAGLLLSLILIITGNEYPSFFSSGSRVQALVKEITAFLAISIFIKYIYIIFSLFYLVIKYVKLANESSWLPDTTAFKALAALGTHVLLSCLQQKTNPPKRRDCSASQWAT